jgi:hypothetical protein
MAVVFSFYASVVPEADTDGCMLDNRGNTGNCALSLLLVLCGGNLRVIRLGKR